MLIARLCRIEGTVQGVGFRYWAEREAARRGVVGWVRNVASGVEAVVQGEEAVVEVMIALLHEGPWGARVQSVDVAEVDLDPTLKRFEVRR